MYNPKEEQFFFDRSKEFLESDITIEQIEDLRRILRYHEYKYAVTNNPESG